MKVAILAGGYGSRLAEETEIRPKPMVEIGGLPILLHIMHHYASFGHTEFVIALGYRGEFIKRYMAEFCSLSGNVTVDLGDGTVRNDGPARDWKIELVETGLETMTAGRLGRLRKHLEDEPFFLTWGDGVSDVNLDELRAFHDDHGRLATVTAVRPPARYGHLEIVNNQVCSFTEKPQLAEGWINGAFFVLDPEVFDYLSGSDDEMLEQGPLEHLAADGQLMAYQHDGFWQCMDTLREKKLLEDLWESGNAPWMRRAPEVVR